MTQLIVAGCSLSDRGGVDFCYGDKLAEKLNYEYVHEGSGCGSNFRIWRIVTNMIMNNEIGPDDVLIIQYTEQTRKEFWTSHLSTETVYDSYSAGNGMTGKVQLVHDYKGFGQLVKYKLEAASWQDNKKIKEFMKLYEEGFVDREYDNEVWKVNHFNFITMLQSRKIKTIFVEAFEYTQLHELYIPDDVFRFYIKRDKLEASYLQPDGTHLSNEGHEYVAEQLRELIQ